MAKPCPKTTNKQPMKTYKQFSLALLLFAATSPLTAQQTVPNVSISMMPDSGHIMLLAASDTSAKTKLLLSQLKQQQIAGFQYTITKSTPKQPNPTATSPTATNTTTGAISEGKNDLLNKLLIGMLLGMAGQLIRVIVGIKKKNDANEAHDPQRLLISLLIGAVIGAVAGVLVIVDDPMKELSQKTTLMAIIAAGYAGADFIEGFIQKNPPRANPPAPAPPVPSR
jgi:hypothetical protein